MTPDEWSILGAMQAWLVLSIAAALPLLWALTLILHFARPYVARRLDGTGGSRLSAEVTWLGYVLIRDGVMALTFALATIFILPGVYLTPGLDLPIGAPLSWLLLLWVFLIKLGGDADRRATPFRVVSLLLVVGAALTIVPEALGAQAVNASYYWDVAAGVGWIAPPMISALNPDAATTILAVTLVAAAVSVVFAFVWLVRRGERLAPSSARG
jgi:hypothetical protein